jgi:hypothetical protein
MTTQKQKLETLRTWIECNSTDALVQSYTDYGGGHYNTEVIKVSDLEDKLQELFGNYYPED